MSTTKLNATGVLEMARWVVTSLTESAYEPDSTFINHADREDERSVDVVTDAQLDITAASPGNPEGAAVLMLHVSTGEIFQIAIERIG